MTCREKDMFSLQGKTHSIQALIVSTVLLHFAAVTGAAVTVPELLHGPIHHSQTSQI